MIVLGLVAGLLVLAMPRLGGQNHQMRSAVRKLSAVTREIQTTAKLQGAVYRLVIDLGKGRDAGAQKFWIEKGTNKTVLTPSEMDDIKDPDADEDDEKKTPALFTVDTKLLKGETSLPGDLRFEDVELRRKEQPATEGKVYIHFFPQGLAEEAAIHLRASEKLRWTLAIHPLTGKTNIMTEYVPLKELGR
jgi:general secretion pathway protein H